MLHTHTTWRTEKDRKWEKIDDEKAIYLFLTGLVTCKTYSWKTIEIAFVMNPMLLLIVANQSKSFFFLFGHLLADNAWFVSIVAIISHCVILICVEFSHFTFRWSWNTSVYYSSDMQFKKLSSFIDKLSICSTRFCLFFARFYSVLQRKEWIIKMYTRFYRLEWTLLLLGWMFTISFSID